MKYRAYLKQEAEGCDYTIGCSQTIEELQADNIDDAKQKLTELIIEEYSHSEALLGSCELYEINELSTVGKMLDLIRRSQLGKVRLDKYMRYDALIGTPQIEAEQIFGLLPGKD